MGKKFELKLEVNANSVTDNQPFAGLGVMMTPAIDEDYWLFRVPVSKDQAVVGFPKFSTIGIGFQHETDWNTNLPYLATPERIYQHIRHNKGSKNIPRARCIAAIQMIRDAAHKLNPDKALWTEEEQAAIELGRAR